MCIYAVTVFTLLMGYGLYHFYNVCTCIGILYLKYIFFFYVERTAKNKQEQTANNEQEVSSANGE